MVQQLWYIALKMKNEQHMIGIIWPAKMLFLIKYKEDSPSLLPLAQKRQIKYYFPQIFNDNLQKQTGDSWLTLITCKDSVANKYIVGTLQIIVQHPTLFQTCATGTTSDTGFTIVQLQMTPNWQKKPEL